MTERAYAPHCDQSILHAPGVCDYCDMYPDWQEFRAAQRINFTGEYSEHFAPCPSEYFRPPEIRDRWPGNTPAGYQSPFIPLPAPEPVSLRRRITRWIRKRRD